MPFLTDLDSRAEVKGSRDPLGLVPIWSSFGREVVGNLTTVSNSVRGFTTLLLGLYYAEKVQELDRTDTPSALETFLKFEQLAGYSRVKFNDDRSVRGVTRVRTRLNLGKRVRISAAGSDQILSNQKVYGLWGLYTMPARASDLVGQREVTLSPAARDLVERTYVPLLGKRVLEILRRESSDFEPEGRDEPIARALARMHGRLSADEKRFYRTHLAWGGSGESTHGRQQLLATLLAEHETKEFSFADFRAVRSRVARLGGADRLEAALDRIDALEPLLNAARVIFGYILTQDTQRVADVARRIGSSWRRPLKLSIERLGALRNDIAAATWAEAGARWLELAAAFRAADYHVLLEKLVEANTDVMQKRNGSAAWVSIESGRFRVRMADEAEHLLSVSEVENLWRSTYFINSLWTVSREVA